MHKSAIAFAIGKLMQVMGLALLAPLGIALYDHYLVSERMPVSVDWLFVPDIFGFVLAILISILFGTMLVIVFRGGSQLQGIKEGYAIVTFGWLMLSFIGAVPLFVWFMKVGGMDGLSAFTNAYFEIMSGFTTTGASILSDIEALPRSLLFLRALTHWLGGMGIITLAIVIFQSLGVSGYQMFRGEVPGPTKDRLQPRLAQTAQILWGVYLLLSAAETILLMIGGMNLFEAVCHTFATMATGGFSTRNSSVASFDSDFIEWVIIIFMYLAGVNVLVHFRAVRGELRSAWADREFKFYSAIIGATIVIVTLTLFFNGLGSEEAGAASFRSEPMTTEAFHEHYEQQQSEIDGLYNSFRTASFQTLSIITTTGFVTADFDLWPNFIRFLLVFLMFFGGCAGSTGGGMKMVRIMIIGKVALNLLRKLTQPRLVAPVKMGRRPVDDAIIVNVVSFFILFIGLFILVAMSMTLFVPDMTTAIALSVATIANVGPGLSGVGAVENFGWLPLGAKWILVFSMLLGRLEIFTVLIVLRPSVWRR